MSTPSKAAALLATALIACGGPPSPSPEDLDAAQVHVQSALSAGERARAALELLGILPVYTCGEERSSFIAKAVDGATARAGCVSARAQGRDATSDAVVLTFSQACNVQGHVVQGEAAFVYSGGKSRMDLQADLAELTVDGEPLRTRVGYGTCGDESRYWAQNSGILASGVEYELELSVRQRPGLPILGGTTLVVDGDGTLASGAGEDRVTSTELEYELGDTAPKSGQLAVSTHDGRAFKATFKPTLWKLGQVEVQVDDSRPVTVPLVR